MARAGGIGMGAGGAMGRREGRLGGRKSDYKEGEDMALQMKARKQNGHSFLTTGAFTVGEQGQVYFHQRCVIGDRRGPTAA